MRWGRLALVGLAAVAGYAGYATYRGIGSHRTADRRAYVEGEVLVRAPTTLALSGQPVRTHLQNLFDNPLDTCCMHQSQVTYRFSTHGRTVGQAIHAAMRLHPRGAR